MQFYPVFMDLRGRTALVVGTGEVAERKAAALRRSGAVVRVQAGFAEGDLDGVALAIGADAPDDALHALSRAAQARGVPVNVVDRPALCSVITPAVVDRDPLLIAIGSGGTAPVLARLVRARIEALIPPAIGRLATLVDGFKDQLRRAWPDPADRRPVIERMLEGPAADLALAGRTGEAQAAMQGIVDGAPAARTGFVHLVGAGPGAADLLTLRGQRLLGEADVIVHDRLVTADVLDLARRDAARIYVGKARANHCFKQHEINDLLVRLAREGNRVVRLKGGDPFVFGRGGEEVAALRAAGVPFAVVPGVTAALACAAQAGIPLTLRDTARTLTFATGHTKDGRLDLDFNMLARSGTIAVYMGIVTLPGLRDGLFAAGLDPRTPAALIERGGTEDQRELRGTLDALVAEASGWTRHGPALVLVGKSVDAGSSPTT